MLVFSVTPFRTDQNKDQNRSIDNDGPESEKRKKVTANTPAKIQVTANLSYGRYAEKRFTENLKRFVWRRHAGAHWAPTWRPELSLSFATKA